jgi:hypothetical protein
VSKVIPAAYDLVVGRADVVMIEIGVDERCFAVSVSRPRSAAWVPSTCALSRLDIRELDALRLDGRPIEVASLPVRDVASLGVCAHHERRLALAIGGGCAGYTE